uniref:helix-turn-helix domain-containing protein n=1 Tax=uncultured Acinetobacter sp. TaxID=165433 RepID=UPI0026078C09|nr:helix-turn-helix domain-containing protein [uncultured Acinetobacter sp.]
MSTIKSAGKVVKVLKALRGHSLKGVSVTELAKQLGESPSQVHRALQTLVDEGLALQLEDESYALGNVIVQIAHAHVEELNRAQGHINEHIQRVWAGARQIQGA